MAEHTPGPWVGFSDQGRCVAIMPAGREGDICTFSQPPSDGDARLMILAPSLVNALEKLTNVVFDAGLTNDSTEAWMVARQLIAAVKGVKEP